jgi:ATP-dependent Clp protease ATP-binding subunit ClpA
MVRDEAATLLKMEEELIRRVKGQDHVMKTVAEGIRGAKAGLKAPEVPMGVFLFVGPSGVGKTETALAIADLLFGGERFMTTINMSEFKEKHNISRLVGSPPGYVGYGEGGLLTEAVRQRPYSVVLLDECEKADPRGHGTVLPGVRQGHVVGRRRARGHLQGHRDLPHEQPRHRRAHRSRHDGYAAGSRDADAA